MTTPIIAVASLKGGVGKSTTATHLAHYASLQGQRVLLVDLDGQSMARRHLGVEVSANQGGAYELLVNHDPYPDTPIPYIPVEALILYNVRPGLDLIANDHDIESALIQIEGEPARETILQRRLATVADAYHLIIIDTMPTRNLASLLVLVAASHVVVPVPPGAASMQGLHDLRELLATLERATGRAPRLLGVLATMIDHRTTIGRHTERGLAQQFRGQFAGTIRERAAVKDGPGRGQTLFEYALGNDATDDYEQACAWLLYQLEANRHEPTAKAVGLPARLR